MVDPPKQYIFNEKFLRKTTTNAFSVRNHSCLVCPKTQQPNVISDQKLDQGKYMYSIIKRDTFNKEMFEKGMIDGYKTTLDVEKSNANLYRSAINSAVYIEPKAIPLLANIGTRDNLVSSRKDRYFVLKES